MATLQVTSGPLPYVYCPQEVSADLRDHLMSNGIQCSISPSALSSHGQHLDSINIDPDADPAELQAAVDAFAGPLPDWFIDLDEST